MSWVNQIKEAMPEYAKDTKLNLDSVINRSTLDGSVANACALAAAMATGNGKLVTFIQSSMEDTTERDAALTAASLMIMTNTWYPYVEMVGGDLDGIPPQLRMNAIASHGGTTKDRFEAYALAASIVGKCHFCIKSHYDTLRKEFGYSQDQLRDIGRIAAVINSVSKILNS